MNAMTWTPDAVEQAKRLLGTHAEAVGLKISVEPSGCAGHSIRIDYAQEVASGERLIDCAGVPLVVSEADLPMLAGIEVDYVRDGLNRMFRFRNPNAREVCGCGESFAL
ncbi:MAG: HesB/IscA family protein [Gammaproteobacteria bacterium]